LRVIGLGQRSSGDDGVGLVVLDALRVRALDDVELVEARDATELIELLIHDGLVVLVDAVVAPGLEVGELLEIHERELDEATPMPVSTHGMSVHQAIGLARTLKPNEVTTDLRILGVNILQPSGHGEGLSHRVDEAVPAAVARVMKMARS
jgi:hydrogenase maturation protease